MEESDLINELELQVIGIQSVSQQRQSVENELQSLEAESLTLSLPQGFNTSETERKRYERTERVQTFNRPVVVLNIVNGSIWGVLVRRGLISLTSYSGTYLGGVVWANFTACFVMGLAIDSSKLWNLLLEQDDEKESEADGLRESSEQSRISDRKVSAYANKGSIPLYVGLTTGFCGTCSSFSSVILEAFNKSTDTVVGASYSYPNHAYGIMEFLSVIFTQIGMSVVGFHLGKHLCDFGDRYSPSLTKRNYKILESLSMVIGVVSIIITCILIGTKKTGSWRSWTFSILFAPFGALLRFYISKYLNTKFVNFPLGTFSANVLGSLVLGVLTILGRGKLSHEGRIVSNVLVCHVISGLDDGFCGGLTTVSTFIVELFALKLIYSYRYAITSIILSFVLVVLTLGSYNWTLGLADPICS